MESWSTCTSNCASDSFIDQGLPPGFRFHPTDEELVTYYLAKKIENPNFTCGAVVEADLNKSEPWELPGKAAMGEKEWYFYSARDRKYPTGMRTNRATQAGYWKATGKDREVMSSCNSVGAGARSHQLQRQQQQQVIVGMKKTLVFYRGRAPKGIKSNWVMHEYRHHQSSSAHHSSHNSRNEWVVCRIFHKSPGGKKLGLSELRQCSHTGNSSGALYTTSLPALLDSPTPAASGSGGGGRPDQETLMPNAFLHYSNNAIKSEPIHSGGGSDGTFHNIGISSMPTQNAITNPMLFSTSRSHVESHLALHGSTREALAMESHGSYMQSNQREPSLNNTLVSHTFNIAQSSVSTSTPSNDHNYHHQLSSTHYINSTPIMDPLLNNTSTSIAPLAHLPSDLDTYWLYSDRLQ